VPKPATEEELEDGRDELTLDTGSNAFFVYGFAAGLSAYRSSGGILVDEPEPGVESTPAVPRRPAATAPATGTGRASGLLV